MQVNNHKIIKSVSALFVGVAVAATVVAMGATVSYGRSRSTSLLNAKCVNGGQGSVREGKQDVSIGRAVYTSLFFLGPGYRSASMTCQIKPDNRPQHPFQILNLGFGMRDNDVNSPPVQVNIFVDGQQVETRTVEPTKQEVVAVDITKVSNVAIEATCSTQMRYCDRVYFFTANLERTPKNPEKK